MTTEPSLPFNQQVYTMTCANDDGAVRTAVHVSTTAQTSDIPDIIDTLYQRLAAQGYHTWLYDHATNTRTDRQGLVDGTTIPVLRDLIDAVVRSEVHILNPALVGESVVETTRLDALLNHCRLIAGIVPEEQQLREVPLLPPDCRHRAGGAAAARGAAHHGRRLGGDPQPDDHGRGVHTPHQRDPHRWRRAGG